MGTVGVKGLSAFAINCWSVWNGLGRESGATKIRKSASARYIYMTVSWASSRQQTMMRPKSVVFWNWAILVGLYLRRRCYCVYTDFDLALQLNFHCIPLSLSLSQSLCLFVSLCVFTCKISVVRMSCIVFRPLWWKALCLSPSLSWKAEVKPIGLLFDTFL